MPSRRTALKLIGMAFFAVPALAQTNPVRGPEGPGGAYGPDQPLRPQVPRLQERPAQPPPAPLRPAPPPGFPLTPEQQAQVDRVLDLWEQHNQDVKTFDCRFKRWVYDVVFGPPNQPKFIEQGLIRYAAPDRGLFQLETEETGGKQMPIDNARAEHWICDGKAIWEYSPAKKQVIEHRLPKELQGKAIANSPLPFLFGAEAKNLKQRYFIRQVAPPPGVNGQIWLEAYPRFQQDAANLRRATFIITAQGMSPYGLEIVQPNGKDFTTYQFYDVAVNDPLKIFKGNPFKPFTPWGWQMILERTLPPAEANRGPSNGRR